VQRCRRRRDPATRPLVTRARAALALDATGSGSGVWSVVLRDLLDGPWPDAVLVPALGAGRAARERDLAGLEVLRRAGAFDDDPLAD
jgi:hypothetical protein